LKLGIAKESDVDNWLKELKLHSLEKIDYGNWYLLHKYGDSELRINITYNENEPSSTSTVGVGCHFLKPPEKNQCKLYRTLLELQALSQECKFGILSSGSIVLVTQRSAEDLDPSELTEMINMVFNMYTQFHNDCLLIVK
jgi:hypothetical protein